MAKTKTTKSSNSKIAKRKKYIEHTYRNIFDSSISKGYKYFRYTPTIIEVRDDEKINSYDENNVDKIVAFAKKHIDVMFEIEESYESSQHIYIRGWRTATVAEKKYLKDILAKEKEQSKDREKLELERARNLLRKHGELK